MRNAGTPRVSPRVKRVLIVRGFVRHRTLVPRRVTGDAPPHMVRSRTAESSGHDALIELPIVAGGIAPTKGLRHRPFTHFIKPPLGAERGKGTRDAFEQ